MLKCKKPVFPVLPSVTTAADEVAKFLSYGHMNFPDEVLLGKALVKIHTTPKPAAESIYLDGVNMQEIRFIIDHSKDGYLSPEQVSGLFSAGGIPMVNEAVCTELEHVISCASELGYPLVMKVVGPIHKTDVGGVELNIQDQEQLIASYQHMKAIDGFESVLIQPMMEGRELFIGATYEPDYGHVVMCGIGGIFVEVLKDIATGLAPLTISEAEDMIRRLRSYILLTGIRGQQGIDLQKFAEIIVRLSTVLRYCKEIKEIDMNPLIATMDGIVVVDARIRIEK
jgi:acetyltransferase